MDWNGLLTCRTGDSLFELSQENNTLQRAFSLKRDGWCGSLLSWVSPYISWTRILKGLIFTPTNFLNTLPNFILLQWSWDVHKVHSVSYLLIEKYFALEKYLLHKPTLSHCLKTDNNSVNLTHVFTLYHDRFFFFCEEKIIPNID